MDTLGKEAAKAQDDLDKLIQNGDILSMFKLGEKIQENARKAQELSYLASFNDDNIYLQYKSLYGILGEPAFP